MQLVWVVTLFSLLVLKGPMAFAASLPSKLVTGQVERVGDMTHFEFSGRQEWAYDLQKKGQTLELTLPQLSDASVADLVKIKSLLVLKVEVNSVADNKSKVLITLADEKIESFDYLTQKPSKLIIDLYVADDKLLQKLTLAEQKRFQEEAKAESGTVADVLPAKSPGKKAKSSGRRPASEFMTIGSGQIDYLAQEKPFSDQRPKSIDELFDFGASAGSLKGGDAAEEIVIEAQGNIYLRFPPLRLENPHLKELASFRPHYEIKKSFSDENKQARTLLALYYQRSFASFIKGKKVFKKNFPKSTYDEILNHVEAETWIELWRENKRPEYLTRAMNLYKLLIERNAESPLAERTLINTGLLAHEVGEYFLATKLLRRYIETYSQSPFRNHVKIYLADSLAQLKNYDDSALLFQEVIKDGTIDTRIEARYRIGDVYFLKQSFRRAEQLYREAIDQHPKSSEKYPSALFNMAESQFNLAEYRASLESFKNFQQSHPSHPYSGLALTRVGELVDIITRDKHRAQGFYNESYYRYRDTIGGALARMRSLSQRFKDMKENELKYSIDEIKRLRTLVNLPQVDEFAAFMISDGYYAKGDFKRASDALIGYFQMNPQPVNIKKFEKRISRAIASQVQADVDRGEPIEALALIERHQKSWLNKSQRVDIQFNRGRIFEQMGLPHEALESYQRLEKRMQGLAGTREEAERKVFEDYPTLDMVKVRQAVAAYAADKTGEALSSLKVVQKMSELPASERFDYYYLLSRFAFEKGQYKEALQSIELITSDLVKGPEKTQRYNLYISEVLEKNDRLEDAIQVLNRYAEQTKGDRDQAYVLAQLFNLQRKAGDLQGAIQIGEQLFGRYAQQINLEKERYYLGELYFLSGQNDKAQTIWKELDQKSMWSELARNRVKSDEWKEKTSKTIDRIPAMQR